MNYEKIYTEETGLKPVECDADGWPENYTNHFVQWQSKRLDKLTAFANDVMSNFPVTQFALKHGLLKEVDSNPFLPRYEKTSLISDKEKK